MKSILFYLIFPVLFLLALFCFSHADSYTMEGKAIFTRSTERDAAYNFIVDNATDSKRNINYIVSKNTNYDIVFSTLSACYELYIDASWQSETKRDAVINFLRNNIDTWIVQKRIQKAEIKVYITKDGEAGSCPPTISNIVYKR